MALFVRRLRTKHLPFLPLTPLPITSSMHHPPNPPVLYSFPDADALSDSLAAFIVEAQRQAKGKRGRFTVALSGGSLPKQLRGLRDNPGIAWQDW